MPEGILRDLTNSTISARLHARARRRRQSLLVLIVAVTIAAACLSNLIHRRFGPGKGAISGVASARSGKTGSAQ